MGKYETWVRHCFNPNLVALVDLLVRGGLRPWPVVWIVEDDTAVDGVRLRRKYFPAVFGSQRQQNHGRDYDVSKNLGERIFCQHDPRSFNQS